MGDLRNKALKKAKAAAIELDLRRRTEGWTVFRFDLDPKFTKRDLLLGEAIRELMRRSHTRIKFWRCPVRGLAIEYRVLPTSSYAWDRGSTYQTLHFSTLNDEVLAKKQLVENTLLNGLEQHRGLPNTIFDEQVSLLRALLKAPPSVSAEEWNTAKAKLHQHFQSLLDTHLATLWSHLLGKSLTFENVKPDTFLTSKVYRPKTE